MKIELKKYLPYPETDIRFQLLDRVVKQLKPFKNNPKNQAVINRVVFIIKKLKLTERELLSLKQVILKDAKTVFPKLAESIINELKTRGDKKITVLSVGSGTSGHTEQLLDELIKRQIDVDINWVGMDINQPGTNEYTFFKENFTKIDPDSKTEFKRAAKLRKSEKFFILANWSYHHMDITFTNFLNRCSGASKIFLIEEPVTVEKWKDINYKTVRLVIDVLGNVAINKTWAKKFLKNPKNFKVRYPTYSEVWSHGKTIDFKGLFPETALIII